MTRTKLDSFNSPLLSSNKIVDTFCISCIFNTSRLKTLNIALSILRSPQKILLRSHERVEQRFVMFLLSREAIAIIKLSIRSSCLAPTLSVDLET